MHLRHADIDRCAYGNRWRNRATGEKLLLSTGMLCCSLLLPPFPASLLIAFAMACISIGLARIPWRSYLRVMSVPAGFALVSACATMISITSNLELVIRREGLLQAGSLLIRSLAAFSALSFLILSTPMEDLFQALRRFGLPDAISEMMLSVQRFIAIFAGTAENIWQAQTARCGYATRRGAWRSLSLLAGSLFVQSLDRARRMEIGLAARGYAGELKLLESEQPASRFAIAAILALQLSICALSIGLDRYPVPCMVCHRGTEPQSGTAMIDRAIYLFPNLCASVSLWRIPYLEEKNARRGGGWN